jgi:hypothetical protein
MKKNIVLLGFVLFSFIVVFPLDIAFAEGEGVAVKRNDDSFAGGLCSGGISGVKDNIFLSAASLCIPGILENIDKFRQIECQALVCKYQAVINGYPSIQCNKMRAYNICTKIYGDIFDIFGFTKLLDAFKSAIAQYWANPYVGVMTYLRWKSKSCTPNCDLENIQGTDYLLAINDLAAATQRLKSIVDNGFSPAVSGGRIDYCKQVEELEIEKHVNDILGIES